MTPNLIHREFARGTQEWELSSYWQVTASRETARLRTKIHADWSYRHQSNATVEKWDGDKWQYVCGTHWSYLPDVSSFNREDAEAVLIGAENAMLKAACSIIGFPSTWN